MNAVVRLLEHYRVNYVKLGNALGLSRGKLNTLLFSTDRALTEEQAKIIATFMYQEHGAEVDEEWLLKVTAPKVEYELGPHGKWDGRPYLIAKDLYKYDPRPTIQELVILNQLTVKDLLDHLGMKKGKFYRVKSWTLDELDSAISYINTEAGRSYSALDVVSVYIPLDKLVY